MTFRAKIRRDSAIWRMWQSQHRVGGQVAGVPFCWAAGNNYVSQDILDADQIVAAHLCSDIELEAAGLDPVIDTPEPEVEPEVHEESPDPPPPSLGDVLDSLSAFKRQRGRPRKHAPLSAS